MSEIYNDRHPSVTDDEIDLRELFNVLLASFCMTSFFEYRPARAPIRKRSSEFIPFCSTGPLNFESLFIRFFKFAI